MNQQHRRRALAALSLGAAGLLGLLLSGQLPSAQAEGQKSVAQVAPLKAEIGKPFKNFTLTNMNSDKKEKISLASFKGKQAVVGIFMANQCGTTWRYEAKIGKLINDYRKKGVAVMAVHTNYNETDQEILGQIESRNLAMPVLDDKGKQELGRYVGARVTLTFFVIDKAGILRYVGSFDDRGAEPAFVVDAVDAILAGKSVAKNTTRPFG